MQMVLHVDWGSCSEPLPTVHVVALCDQLECSTRIDSSDIALAAVSIIKCEPTELAYLSVDRDECRPVMLTRVDRDKVYVKVSK